MAIIIGRGYRNGYPFPEGENIVLGETNPFYEDWNCAWSNGYPFAKAANHPGEMNMFLEICMGHEIDMRHTQIAVSPSQ